MPEKIYDLIIVGGGIHGAAIARDAAGRGYSVCLIERADLAGGTSSASTKLIHGGVRHLGKFAFGALFEGLRERQTLRRIAPHIVMPRRLVLPHHKGLRPAWMLRLGLFVYDHVAGRSGLAPSRTIHLRNHPAGRHLRPQFDLGFETSDCMADDARLVILNAQDAAARGANILTRTEMLSAHALPDRWQVLVRNVTDGSEAELFGRMIVNATGPWANDLHRKLTGSDLSVRLHRSKGSHIVVQKTFAPDTGYMFQNADGRVVFALPFARDYTLIGTTQSSFEGNPAEVGISSSEIDYLCDVASEYFLKPVTRRDVVWGYAGVQAVPEAVGKSKTVRNGHALVLQSTDACPLLDVLGGRLTTHRKLAEDALGLVDAALGRQTAAWTADEFLPGGDFRGATRLQLEYQLLARYSFLTPAHVQRLVDTYGAETEQVLDGAKSLAELGERFGDSLTAREVDYLCAREWAQTADDIVWRRTKLGLSLDQRSLRALEAYVNSRKPAQGKR